MRHYQDGLENLYKMCIYFLTSLCNKIDDTFCGRIACHWFTLQHEQVIWLVVSYTYKNLYAQVSCYTPAAYNQ